MMKRLVVLLAISAAALGALGVACGGPDKPPLTPDDGNPLPPDTTAADAGATPATPAPPAK
jgi:hypothetical protein